MATNNMKRAKTTCIQIKQLNRSYISIEFLLSCFIYRYWFCWRSVFVRRNQTDRTIKNDGAANSIATISTSIRARYPTRILQLLFHLVILLEIHWNRNEQHLISVWYSSTNKAIHINIGPSFKTYWNQCNSLQSSINSVPQFSAERVCVGRAFAIV